MISASISLRSSIRYLQGAEKIAESGKGKASANDTMNTGHSLTPDSVELDHLRCESGGFSTQENERRVAIVGSKSLADYRAIYEIIDEVVSSEVEKYGPFILINGGEEGVDLMAAEIAMARGLEYELEPLEECRLGCERKYCFDHSYKPRSERIAHKADRIYRIYDESCETSTCEVTAKFGEAFGKEVIRKPVDLLLIER